MADMKQVLSKLEERTIENRVPWENSTQPGMFRASVGNLTVYIARRELGPHKAIMLTVADNRGETIGDLAHNPVANELNNQLVSLYDHVQKFLANDPRLDQLLDALDAAPRVSQTSG